MVVCFLLHCQVSVATVLKGMQYGRDALGISVPFRTSALTNTAKKV